MGREERRLKDHSKFLNSISTLCHVFRRVRLADGATIKILATPILKYMQLLLEYNRDDDIELFGSQVRDYNLKLDAFIALVTVRKMTLITRFNNECVVYVAFKS